MSILLATDETIRQLNRKYRQRDSATDVLAFSMSEGEFGDINPDVLGDVIISVETAQKQALEAGHSPEQELATLLVHGLLHLAGYDHEKGEEEAHRMEEKAKQIMGILN